MKVYHTSTIEIINPDIIHSREGLDFGKGFYCTVLREQAEAYGLRFSLREFPRYSTNTSSTLPISNPMSGSLCHMMKNGLRLSYGKPAESAGDRL